MVGWVSLPWPFKSIASSTYSEHQKFAILAPSSLISTSSLQKENASIGLKVLHPGVKPVVDIIAVHGLKGDAYKTWTAKGKGEIGEDGVMWLRDLLPREIQDARIMTYGYNSEPSEMFASASTNMVHQHAATLVAALYANRVRARAKERPVIWIAHSLGGILVKQALIYSNSCGPGNNEDLRSIKTSTYGILFMGTPHMGSSIAKWGTFAESMIRLVTPKAVVDTNHNLINVLKQNSETLQNITALFTSISNDFRLFFFWEELTTLLPNGSRELIVDYASAVSDALPNVQKAAIHATHSDMCKFDSEEAPGYEIVVAALIQFCEAAPEAIATKWMHDRQSSYLSHQYRVGDIIKTANRIPGQSGHPEGNLQLHISLPSGTQSEDSLHPRLLVAPGHEGDEGTATPGSDEGHWWDAQSQLTPAINPNEPSFMIPYHPNECFEGRDAELEKLGEILRNPKKRAIGNTSVVISALPGGGKTHLVRQYAFEKRHEYSGGIYWVRSMSGVTLRDGFWRIAVRRALLKGNKRQSKPGEPEDEAYVCLVKEWFETHEKWLLIFDGADLETDMEINLLSDFVPAGKGGSVIFTTLNNRLVGCAPLGSPEGMELKTIDTEHSVKMLLHYARILEPTEQDMEEATELVKYMGHLPLAIHSGANYIKEKRVSLTQYLNQYKKQPKVQGLESFYIILDQLKGRHVEATNLIRILAFVGQDVPVEMLQWGIRALRKKVQLIAEDQDGPDFNVTIGHLLSYSLVDRQSIVQVDDARKVDTLLLHNVVQNVCLSRMRNDDKLHKWLLISAKLFCHSFTRMELRRRDRDFPVSDYRRFQVHIAKLLEHAKKMKLPLADTAELEDVMSRIENAIAHYAPKYIQCGDGNDVDYSPPQSQFGVGYSSSLDDSILTPSPDQPFPGGTIFPDTPAFPFDSPIEAHPSYFPPSAMYQPNFGESSHQETQLKSNQGWNVFKGKNKRPRPNRVKDFGSTSSSEYTRSGRPKLIKPAETTTGVYREEIIVPKQSAGPRPPNDPVTSSSSHYGSPPRASGHLNWAQVAGKALSRSREHSSSPSSRRPTTQLHSGSGHPTITESPPVFSAYPPPPEPPHHFPVKPLQYEHIGISGSPLQANPFFQPRPASLPPYPHHITASETNFPLSPEDHSIYGIGHAYSAPRNISEQTLTATYSEWHARQSYADIVGGRGRPYVRNSSSRDVSPRGIVSLRPGAHEPMSRVPSEAWTEPLYNDTPLGSSPVSQIAGTQGMTRIKSDEGGIPHRVSPRMGQADLVFPGEDLTSTMSPPPGQQFTASPPPLTEVFSEPIIPTYQPNSSGNFARPHFGSAPMSRAGSHSSLASLSARHHPRIPLSPALPPSTIIADSPILRPEGRVGYHSRRESGPGFHLSGISLEGVEPGSGAASIQEGRGSVITFGDLEAAELIPHHSYPIQFPREFTGMGTTKAASIHYSLSPVQESAVAALRRSSAPAIAPEQQQPERRQSVTTTIEQKHPKGIFSRPSSPILGDAALMQRSISEPVQAQVQMQSALVGRKLKAGELFDERKRRGGSPSPLGAGGWGPPGPTEETEAVDSGHEEGLIEEGGEGGQKVVGKGKGKGKGREES